MFEITNKFIILATLVLMAEDLKARIAIAAERAGKTVHAVIRSPCGRTIVSIARSLAHGKRERVSGRKARGDCALSWHVDEIDRVVVLALRGHRQAGGALQGSWFDC